MSLVVDCKNQNTSFWNRDENTLMYFDDIRNTPLLSQEEERELLRITKMGDANEALAARNRLVECNQRFIVSVARKWASSNNLLDIVNEANLGLLEAIDEYDINLNNRLLTYAIHHIRKHIQTYVVTKQPLMHPKNPFKIYNYVAKVKNKFFAENHYFPSNEQVQEILWEKYKIRIAHSEDIQQYNFESIYANESDCDKDGHALTYNVDYEVKTATNNISDHIEQYDKRIEVDELLSNLPEREQSILRYYYGIGCNEISLDEIAEKVHLSHERVRQIIKSSIDKLKEKSL